MLVNTGIADEVRYGLRSYKFIYSHYTYLVYNEVLLYSILATEDKRNAVFKIMSLLSIAATFRTKGFITIAFILAYYLLNFAKKKRISFKDIFKPVYIAPIGIVCFFISKNIRDIRSKCNRQFSVVSVEQQFCSVPVKSCRVHP